MKHIASICLLFLLIFANCAFAETSIKAEVDKALITMGEDLTYKIIITSSEKSLPQPQIPNFKGFNVISQAQSSTISFMKSNIKNILVYSFILVALDAGKVKIEPSSIKIKDKTYSTEAFEIEVTPGKSKPKAPQVQRPSLPEAPQSESEEPQVTL